MMPDMDYNTIYRVINSWDALKRIDEYEKTAGRLLFQRLFAQCKDIKTLFGFPINVDAHSEMLLKSKRFSMHAAYMIRMLDQALSLLGPDDEILYEILSDLGKKHARYGVKAEYFPLMGEALHQTLKELLQDKYTEEDASALKEVYSVLSTEICKTMDSEKAVMKSWESMKKIDNYQETFGCILFRRLFEKCPPAKKLFGFPLDMDPNSKLLSKSKRFKLHAEYFVEMLDNALNMMENRTLGENMKRLGKIHLTYGVKPEYFPLMGEALIDTLRETLQNEFNLELEEAWKEVYKKLSSQMVHAMN